MRRLKPIVLVVLDGWGETNEKKGNPLKVAQLPTIKKLNQFYPKIYLQASGISVGVPWGESGNSEIGHQTMGSGRITYQNLPRIALSIENGTFFQNKYILKAMQKAKSENKAFHILGLLSDGGVHAHIDHIFAVLEMAKEEGLTNVFVHAITDGRDTPPASGEKYIQKLQRKINKLGIAKIATLSGRYYTMDRNNNWDRIEKAFRAMTEGKGILEEDPLLAIQKQFKKKVYDEYLEPVVITEKGIPVGLIKDGDCVFFVNYREDRARQITKAFVEKKFDKFSKETKRPCDITFVTMIEYEKNLPTIVAFPTEKIEKTLGEVLSENGKKQLRIAETEKYAHVTYFFNGGKEKPFKREDRILIPSKNAPSYADIPEMSAREITQKLIEEIEKNKYDFILVNYANPDMVGHTGNFDASVKAVEVVDECLNKLIKSVLIQRGCLIITADHGNVEEVINLKTGERDTEHSSNPVPCWFVTPYNHREEPKNQQEEEEDEIKARGLLCDVAPTILDLLNIPKPNIMTGDSLLPWFIEKKNYRRN